MEPSSVRELENLQTKFVLMAEMVLDIVTNALAALESQDRELATETVRSDKAIDQIEMDIDSESIRYMTLRQPVASAMRTLTTLLKATRDLERIGDEAKAIAKRVRLLEPGVVGKIGLGCIPEMGRIAIDMARDASNSLNEHDIPMALGVIRRDKQVDSLNRTNFDEFGKRIAERPESAQSMIAMILISKSIERIADHATNLAEETIFLVSGKEVRHSGLKKKLDEEDEDADLDTEGSFGIR